MEPKTNVQTQAGPGFSITINLSPPKTEPLVIDNVEEVEQIEEVKPKRKKKA